MALIVEFVRLCLCQCEWKNNANFNASLECNLCEEACQGLSEVQVRT